MNDASLLTLCAFEEANLEPDEGIAAVVRVVLTRVKAHYECAGTVASAIFEHDQFSWTEWAMQGGHYTEVAKTPAEVQARAIALLDRDDSYVARWDHIANIVEEVQAGTFHGPLYDQITDRVLLYDNLAITQPAWATPDKFVVKIGHHSFFHA